MVKRLSDLPLATDPRTEWRYSVGLDVLGLVIARVSGKPLDRFAADRIFAPLTAPSGLHVEQLPDRGERGAARASGRPRHFSALRDPVRRRGVQQRGGPDARA